MRRQLQQLPSRDPNDPGFRRPHYIRYVDDWLLGFTGTRGEAEEIKGKVCRFLQQRRDGGRQPLVAHFGGIPHFRKRTAILTDRQPTMAGPYNGLVHRAPRQA